MNTLTAEIRNQLLTINDEQIHEIKKLKEKFSCNIRERLEQIIETFRKEIFGAYLTYFSSVKKSPLPPIVQPDPGPSPVADLLFKQNHKKKLEKELTKITKELGDEIQTMLQPHFEGCVSDLNTLCKKYDAVKEQTAAGFCRYFNTVRAPQYAGTAKSIDMSISKMEISLSEDVKLSEILDPSIPLLAKLWKFMSNNCDQEINTAAEKTIAFLTETFSKQLAENIESIFTPLIDELTEQSKKIITNG